MLVRRLCSVSIRRGSRTRERALFEPLEPRWILSAAAAPLIGADSVHVTDAAALEVAHSALGGNLNMQSDRVQDHPFTNLVKTTRGFYNLAGRTAGNGKLDFASTDADGWPTEPFTFSFADNSEYGVPVDAGTYHMQFRGPADVTVGVRRSAPAGAATVPDSAPLPTLSKLSYDPATGTHTYDITVPAGVLTLALEFNFASGGVRDIVVLQPGYNLASFPTFTDAYLNLLRNMSPNVLRLMDFTQTNNNPVSTWSQRTQPSAATQTKVANPGDLVQEKGIAWEYAVELANTLGTSVWINVPAQADDNYIDNLATLLRDSLSPNLKIFVEYSNEVWNSGFNQSAYNNNQAKSEVAADPN
jgi:hypothetical protein